MSEEPGTMGERREAWFPLFGVTMLLFVGYFGHKHQPTEMGIAVGACLLAMMLSRLENFTEFSGLGIAAKLREAKQQASEAYATAAAVRASTNAMAAIVVQVLAKFDLWGGGVALPEKLSLWRELGNQLAKLGVQPHEVKEMGAPLEFVTQYLLAQSAKKAAIGNHQEGPKWETDNEELQALFDFHEERKPSSVELRAELERRGLITEPVEERLKDLEHFEKTAELRRPEIGLL